ncbi:WhiB family transcriptional regulator [Streptomyces sp. CA-135486]|uniref:WhiB family transcriptional regulator n=1 Tax=Streptomyces sp. CA-135486 TaxID=3240049 RepID=UPI003D93D205
MQAAWDYAKTICARCPVLEECHRDTLGEDFGVWGGRDEHERHLERRKLPRKAKSWEPALRLAWGKELSRLRPKEAPVDWADIRRMTGITKTLAEELIQEWREHRKAQDVQAATVVIDLPLPSGPDFPDVRGRRDCWVRHNSRVADAHYHGQTADGRWIRVQVKAGRGNTLKWVKAENVRFHDPKPPVILEYVGRPDGPNARAS